MVKVKGVSSNKDIEYISTPIGGNKWLFKIIFFIESFIQESIKTVDHPLTKQVFMNKFMKNLLSVYPELRGSNSKVNVFSSVLCTWVWDAAIANISCIWCVVTGLMAGRVKRSAFLQINAVL